MKNLLSSRENYLFPASFEKAFDRILENPLSDSIQYPCMDIIEDEKSLTIHALIPGMKKEDIIVEFNNNERPELTISGETNFQYTENIKYHIKELKQSRFKRKIRLPKYITQEPDATLTDGVLTLKWEIPKEPEPKRITIQ